MAERFITLELCDGKYTLLIDDKTSLVTDVKRYGEHWRSVSGDKLIHALVCEVIEQRARADKAEADLRSLSTEAVDNPFRD